MISTAQRNFLKTVLSSETLKAKSHEKNDIGQICVNGCKLPQLMEKRCKVKTVSKRW